MFGGNIGEFSGSQVGAGYVTEGGTNREKESGSNRQSRSNEQSLIPVRIHQILEAPEPQTDNPMRIDGKELSNIAIVGKVTSIDVQTTNTAVTLNDGTGEIQVKVWNSDDGSESLSADVRQEVYVKVIGRVTIYRQTRSVTGYHVRVLNSEKEVQLHELEAAYAHKMNVTRDARHNRATHGGSQRETGAASASRSGALSSSAAGASAFGAAAGAPTGVGAATSAFGADMMDADDEFGPTERRIRDYLQQDSVQESEEGAHYEDLMRLFAQSNLNEVREAVERLVTAGHLYTTTDEEHFKWS